jgi:uncharacterized membrane protein
MGHLLDSAKVIIEYLARGVEFAAALIIGLAAIEATVRAIILFFKPSAPPEAKNNVRLNLGRWLDIEKLAAIATLRTALNYFLEREIQQEAKPQQIEAEAAVTGPKANPLKDA